MTAFDIQKWERTKVLCRECNVSFDLKTDIILYDKKGLILGGFEKLDDVYNFMCGYQYSVK